MERNCLALAARNRGQSPTGTRPRRCGLKSRPIGLGISGHEQVRHVRCFMH